MARRDWKVTGDRTGRTWSYHIAADSRSEDPGAGQRWRVTDDAEGSGGYYHEYPKSDLYAEDIPRMRTAIEVASLPEIAASSVILRLLDVRDTPDVPGEYGHPGALGVVWELADLPLNKFLAHPDSDRRTAADEVERNVGHAIDELHAVGWIHCDISPNNVLRVEGHWKLADLDACTRRGEQARWGPKAERYHHPRRRAGDTRADDDFDQFGLSVIVRQLRDG